ncbi:MAG: zinc ribbon domain-containing protein [Spirochaetales bacterium]
MKPRFFCEHCKNEVSARDKVCPHCGRFFSEVRCPKCGFTGEGKLFFDGCPNCGYLSSKFKDFSGGSGLELVDLRAIESKEDGLSFSYPRKEGKKGKNLSLWSFLVITITLAVILGMLVYLFISLQ